ncbi:cytochrome P450 [Rhizodiscina lignyota]|uniref:Cytochrome P450 n=1 Tax=Rhizodiscina lignyota TaxID=1504668 RepID=A0A9P4MAC6_9PEZI|nr:cytochrome P450 [Rhizodiscina lignyota]
MTANYFLAIIIGASAVLYILWSIISPKKHGAPLPPGPRGKPIIGNLFDLPSPGEPQWLHWLRHKDLYGPLSSITVMGQTFIIINDRNLVTELLEKRATKNSSRPQTVFAMEIVGWDESPVGQDNTGLLRSYRKAMARVIGSHAAVSKFDGMQEVEIRRLLWRVLRDPDNYVSHIRKMMGSLLLALSHGYIVEPHGEDPFMNLAELAINEFAEAITPGEWLVDFIPALKYLPEWFPGGGFKKTARRYAKTRHDFVHKPFAFTKYQMAHNRHIPSLVSSLIEQGEDDRVSKWSSAALYSAGADSTSASLESFFLAMILNPEVQAKGQAEIDRVVGDGRLPVFSDRDSLPFVDAISKEVLRWHTLAPLAIPHKADEDDIVNGYFIPKGAILLPNSWAINHDEKVYREPSKFDPDRWLASAGHEPEADHVSFGYGRRICPGRYVASRTIFLIVAQCLAAFSIRKATGGDGREIEPELGVTADLISHVLPFSCTITPRSPKYIELVNAVEQDYPFQKSDAEILEHLKY